jgi:hypothetical protein
LLTRLRKLPRGIIHRCRCLTSSVFNRLIALPARLLSTLLLSRLRLTGLRLATLPAFPTLPTFAALLALLSLLSLLSLLPLLLLPALLWLSLLRLATLPALLLLVAHLCLGGVALRVLRGTVHRFSRLLHPTFGFVDAFSASFRLLLLQAVL